MSKPSPIIKTKTLKEFNDALKSVAPNVADDLYNWVVESRHPNIIDNNMQDATVKGRLKLLTTNRMAYDPNAVFRYTDEAGKNWVARKIWQGKNPVCSISANIEKIINQAPEILAHAHFISTTAEMANGENETLLISPFLTNGNLLDVANRQKTDEGRINLAFRTLPQISNIHSKTKALDLFFLDGKPENFYIDDEGNVKLSDVKMIMSRQDKGRYNSEKNELLFTTRLVRDEIHFGADFFTAAYMPPEAFENPLGQKSLNHEKVFAYQLGLTIYEVLCPDAMKAKRESFAKNKIYNESYIIPDFSDPLFETPRGKILKYIISGLTAPEAQRWNVKQIQEKCDEYFEENYGKLLDDLQTIRSEINDPHFQSTLGKLSIDLAKEHIKINQNHDLSISQKVVQLENLHEKTKAIIELATAHKGYEEALKKFEASEDKNESKNEATSSLQEATQTYKDELTKYNEKIKQSPSSPIKTSMKVLGAIALVTIVPLLAIYLFPPLFVTSLSVGVMLAYKILKNKKEENLVQDGLAKVSPGYIKNSPTFFGHASPHTGQFFTPRCA